jgi:hypothetical protein
MVLCTENIFFLGCPISCRTTLKKGITSKIDLTSIPAGYPAVLMSIQENPTMATPFPGMDPYLETDSLWASFHHHMATSVYQLLLPSLVDRYKARIGQRHYTTLQALFTSIIQEDHLEEFIEIRHRHDTRIVTLIDMVGPANKTLPTGRLAYLAKRQECKAQHANLVEIDLVLQAARSV